MPWEVARCRGEPHHQRPESSALPLQTGAHSRRADLWDHTLSHAVEESNRGLLRARDAMARSYARPLDVPTLARTALVSEAHFIRTFATYPSR